jgi:hypothetical protein
MAQIIMGGRARGFRNFGEGAVMAGWKARLTLVWARKTYPRTFTQTTPDDVSVEAYAVRQCITKGAFAELRGA